VLEKRLDKYTNELDKLREKKQKLFNYEKLRRTVIYGIPCEFVPKASGDTEHHKP